MDKTVVAAWLNSLTDQQFITFFYESLSSRHLHEPEREFTQSHLVLANASRMKDENDGWEPWQLEVLCPTPGEAWVDDAPVCQYGSHCGVVTASWAKRSVCPICGGEVYGT
jgi:hypothetical protein